jgi:hypothetical protein
MRRDRRSAAFIANRLDGRGRAGGGMSSVNKVPIRNGVNRLSPLQSDIIDYLNKVGQAKGDYIGHLPTTGDIIVGIGKAKVGATCAAVSRSLSRLCRSGFVVAYSSGICTQGRGFRYALAPALAA